MLYETFFVRDVKNDRQAMMPKCEEVSYGNFWLIAVQKYFCKSYNYNSPSLSSRRWKHLNQNKTVQTLPKISCLFQFSQNVEHSFEGKGKRKSCPCAFLIEHHAMKAYWRVEVQLHTLTSALDGGEW
jgi:hypothetical protein